MGMPNAAERWTADRVRKLPDDGKRYELVSGQLVVTPSPRYSHQAAISELEAILRAAVRSAVAEGPARLHVLHSPADISLGEDEILQPDLFVFRTATGLPGRDWSDITALELVIEVLSPGSARYDRGLKRLRYQRGRVPEYWIVDLDARLIERWRPEDQRPEILAGQLSWRPEGGAAECRIDVPAFFAAVLGDSAAG